MSSNIDFLAELNFGKQGQDFLINYLEKNYNLIFVAGERFGDVINIEFIEQLEHGEFIPAKMTYPGHGPQLKLFGEYGEETLTLPDFLMRDNSDESLYWAEVKRHHNDSNSIWIDEKSYDDYVSFYQNYTHKKLLVYCINPINKEQTLVNIYYCLISNLIVTNCSTILYDDYGKKKYIWKIFKTMKKLNNHPILFSDYLE